MVKLFVGNLSDVVDSHRLRNLFLQYVNVQECDVLKNFAFVHVATESDASLAIDKLDKAMLEGREIHIERSTSRLRKEPGMSDKCFTCGASDHKTPQCPQEMGRRKVTKRPNEDFDTNGNAKRANTAQCWGYKVGSPTLSVTNSPVVTSADPDPEIPLPVNPELHTLHSQYMDARMRYHYLRDRLVKEIKLQPTAALSTPVPLTRVDFTRTASGGLVPGGYSVPPTVQQQPAVSVASQPVVYPGAVQTPTVGSYPGAAASAPQALYRTAPQVLQQQPPVAAAYPGASVVANAPVQSYPGAQPGLYSAYKNSPA